MEIYFSNTKHKTGLLWECTIAPASIRKGYTPEIGDTYSDEEAVSVVNEKPNKNNVVVHALKSFPCVGRPYRVEKK